ncbi:AEC family transporter [Humisphaera borealis]|uniref:AEC family transporter n=1 Tax=Humisphaera borealis TaxID=2807512 RepID=A0A7M2WZB6_9BACT|nr:AEC family transporter [Humisphaera borealis]QOV90867.1 AEC family transporter [Humisphaera borealis]
MITSILFNILGPILVLVLLGSLARWRFKIDVGSLSKLNIYIFLPAFFFDHVVNSELSIGQAAGVVLATVLQVAILGGFVWGVGRAVGASRKTIAAMAMCVMFYNAGNYGLALSELAYPGKAVSGVRASPSADSGPQSDPTAPPPFHAPPTAPTAARNGPAVQAFVVFCQNILNFTVGLFIAGSAGGGSAADSLRKFVRMPTAYTLAIALLARWWRVEGGEIPKIVNLTAQYLSRGLVPLALITLGAQLALQPRWPRWKPVSFVLVVRLLWAPAQMALMLYGLHRLFVGRSEVLALWPWPAENLILTAGVPTAINTLLVTLEVGGDAELTADCVFWTTAFSAITITFWLVLLQSGWITS